VRQNADAGRQETACAPHYALLFLVSRLDINIPLVGMLQRLCSLGGATSSRTHSPQHLPTATFSGYLPTPTPCWTVTHTLHALRQPPLPPHCRAVALTNNTAPPPHAFPTPPPYLPFTGGAALSLPYTSYAHARRATPRTPHARWHAAHAGAAAYHPRYPPYLPPPRSLHTRFRRRTAPANCLAHYLLGPFSASLHRRSIHPHTYYLCWDAVPACAPTPHAAWLRCAAIRARKRGTPNLRNTERSFAGL